jgi:probable HAF family extracellular repeat protein
MRKAHRSITVAVASLMLAATALSAQTNYLITDLGSGRPSSLNDDGRVVIYDAAANATRVWTPVVPNSTNGTTQVFPIWDSETGGALPYPLLINHPGMMAGSLEPNLTNIWVNHIMHFGAMNTNWYWGDLTPYWTNSSQYYNSASPVGMNAASQIAVNYDLGAGYTPEYPYYPIRTHLFQPEQDSFELGSFNGTSAYLVYEYEEDGYTHYRTNYNHWSTAASGINDAGQAAGWSEAFDPGTTSTSNPYWDFVHYRRAFLYQPGQGVFNLGTLESETPNTSPAESSAATALNQAGQVVGFSSTPDGTRAFRWTPTVPNGTSGTMQNLGLLPGADFSIASDISSAPAPQAVGRSGANGVIRAFVHDDTHGMRDLNGLIPTNSGWHLAYAEGINVHGQIIGYGTGPDGLEHGFLLTPPGVVGCMIVGITSPINGACTYQPELPPHLVVLEAAVASADGSIAQVDFYDGNTLLGSVTEAPWSMIWTNPPLGQRTLTAHATDSLGHSGRSFPANLRVFPANQAPVVNLGADRTVYQPANVVALSSEVTDDGLPVPSQLSYHWSVVSAPSPASYGDPGFPHLVVTLPVNGTYVFRLTVSDGVLSSFDDVAVTLTNAPPPPVNLPPVVNAGSNIVARAACTNQVAGKIAVSHDEWLMSDSGFQYAPEGSRQLALNLAKYYTGGETGRFMVYSWCYGTQFLGAQFSNTLAQAGHSLTNWTVSEEIEGPEGPQTVYYYPTLADLQQFDAVFLAGSGLDSQLLIDYVNGGGKVFLSGGTFNVAPGVADGSDEAALWNVFLGAFGLKYQPYNWLDGVFPVTGKHELLQDVPSLYVWNGNTIVESTNASPHAAVVDTLTVNGVGYGDFAVYDSTPKLLVTLNGAASDDGNPTNQTLTVRWSVVTGPGAVTFGSPTNAVTTAKVAVPGLYVLRLTATDGEHTVTDDLTLAFGSECATPPVALPDVFQVSQDSGTNVLAVLDNDVSLEGEELVLFSATAAAHGTVSFAELGTLLTYTPEPGWWGVDDFTYTVLDANGGLATATVTVFVNQSGNIPPVAEADLASVPLEGQTVVIVVLGNDSDADEDTLYVHSVTAPRKGTVGINPTGTLNYTRTVGVWGQDTFSYAVTDGKGGLAIATVTVGDWDADGDGLPDKWEVLYGLNTSVNDAESDNDQDGLNNASEFALRANPLHNDAPVITGVTSGMTLTGTVTVTVEFSDQLPSPKYVAITANGESIPETELVEPAGAFSVQFVLNTARLTNGSSALLVSVDYDQPEQDESELGSQTITVNSSPVEATVFNEISFPDWWDAFGENSLLFRATSAHSEVDWQVHIYDSQNAYVGTANGHSPNGNIEVVWDLRDSEGVKREDSQFSFVVATSWGQGLSSSSATPIQTKAATWYPPVGKWVVTHQRIWGDAIPSDNLTMEDAQQSAWSVALGSGGFVPDGGDPSAPGYLLDNLLRRTQEERLARRLVWAGLYSSLPKPEARNFYYFGHGGKNQLGASDDVSHCILTTAQLAQRIKHRYRFIFIDGCNTAKGGLPKCFGIFETKDIQNLSEYDKTGVRPGAFVGWEIKKQYKSGGQMPGKFPLYRINFWTYWALQDYSSLTNRNASSMSVTLSSL